MDPAEAIEWLREIAEVSLGAATLSTEPEATRTHCRRARAANAGVDALKRLAELENAIAWDTHCISCARILDASICDHERAEKAEERLTEVERTAARLLRASGPGASWGEHSTAERALRDLLNGPRPRPRREGMKPNDVDAVLELGRLSLAFGRVDRITYHEDGVTPESDADHTVMLGLVACAFAARHLPNLDLGRIAQYALVHDLVEVYAGDTPTLRISAHQKAVKRERERLALERIGREFALRLPWLPDMIHRYERRADPEARYVKALDKLLPKITHLLNGGVTLQQHAMGHEELGARYAAQGVELLGYAADFPLLLELRTALVRQVLAIVRDGDAA